MRAEPQGAGQTEEPNVLTNKPRAVGSLAGSMGEPLYGSAWAGTPRNQPDSWPRCRRNKPEQFGNYDTFETTGMYFSLRALCSAV